MTVDMNVFVAPGCTLDEVVECVERVTGHRLEKETNEWGPFYCKAVMGIRITAHAAQDYEDVPGIEFSRYDIQVGFESGSVTYANQLRSELCRTLALLTAIDIHEKMGCDCLVVKGVQQVIKSFSSSLGPSGKS
jgi:hypothetical protein